ncbi:hypothetical protein Goshw_000534, partial [Gossypium schwendimanii]|nr:hypothetical protein [Gossypium schwendimanii]
MKQLIRRLSRVADASSQYSLLRSDTASTRHRITRRAESFRIAVASLKKPARRSVPEGHVPVYVGEEMERFLVNAELLNHPVFVSLLNKSAQEYGYDQKGVLHIPCHVLVFERVMEALRQGADLRDLQDLLRRDFTTSSLVDGRVVMGPVVVLGGRIEIKLLEENFGELDDHKIALEKEQYVLAFILRLIGGFLILDKSRNL